MGIYSLCRSLSVVATIYRITLPACVCVCVCGRAGQGEGTRHRHPVHPYLRPPHTRLVAEVLVPLKWDRNVRVIIKTVT